jgi:hypothetical protein
LAAALFLLLGGVVFCGRSPAGRHLETEEKDASRQRRRDGEGSSGRQPGSGIRSRTGYALKADHHAAAVILLVLAVLSRDEDAGVEVERLEI